MGLQLFFNLSLRPLFIYCACEWRQGSRSSLLRDLFQFPWCAISLHGSPCGIPVPSDCFLEQLLTGFASQSHGESLRAHPHPWDHILDQFANSSDPVWVNLMGLELRGSISNPRCLEMPLFYYNCKALRNCSWPWSPKHAMHSCSICFILESVIQILVAAVNISLAAAGAPRDSCYLRVLEPLSSLKPPQRSMGSDWSQNCSLVMCSNLHTIRKLWPKHPNIA